MLSFYVFVCSFYRWMAPPQSRLHLQVCFLEPRKIALVVLFSSCILLGWRLTFWVSQRLVNEDVHHFERNLHLISSHISTRYSNCDVHSSNAHLHRSYPSDNYGVSVELTWCPVNHAIKRVLDYLCMQSLAR